MIDQPFQKLVENLAAKTPTPGGGAAAALAGCMGTALFLMVVRFARGKKANVDREADLARAEVALAEALQQLLPMAERDCRAFDAVSAAYAMPKDTEAQKVARQAAAQAAMVGAMAVPAEMLGMVRSVFHLIAPVQTCIGKAIVSDLASGAALLLAAAEGAFLNVQINAQVLTDRDRAAAAMAEAQAVRADVVRQQQAIAATVAGLLA